MQLKLLLRASSLCPCFIINFVPDYVKNVTDDASQVFHVRGIRHSLLFDCAHRRIMCHICKRMAVWLVNLKRIKCTFCGLNLVSVLHKLFLPELGLGAQGRCRAEGRCWNDSWRTWALLVALCFLHGDVLQEDGSSPAMLWDVDPSFQNQKWNTPCRAKQLLKSFSMLTSFSCYCFPTALNLKWASVSSASGARQPHLIPWEVTGS